MQEIVDFTAGMEPIPFRLGEDVLYAMGDIPLDLGMVVKDLDAWDGTPETQEKMLAFFDAILQPESAQVFRRKITNREIGLRVIYKMLPWLLEKYGMSGGEVRPTEPSLPSSDLSMGNDGMTSTDGALSAE